MRSAVFIVQVFLTSIAVAKRGETPDWGVTFKGRKFSERTVVTKHEDVVLECEAGGSPTPTIHWLKDGVRIQQVRGEKCSNFLFYFFLYFFFHF